MLFCVKVSKVNLFPAVPYLTEKIEKKKEINPYMYKSTGVKPELGRVACIFHLPSFFPSLFGY